MRFSGSMQQLSERLTCISSADAPHRHCTANPLSISIRSKKVVQQACHWTRAKKLAQDQSMTGKSMQQQPIRKPRASSNKSETAQLYLASLMMRRMACSHVQSEAAFTDASSSLKASFASSCNCHADPQLHAWQNGTIPAAANRHGCGSEIQPRYGQCR